MVTNLKNFALSTRLYDADETDTVVTNLNDNINTLSNNVKNTEEYSAFEVFPTITDILSGTTSDVRIPVPNYKGKDFLSDDVLSVENKLYVCILSCNDIKPTESESWNTYWQEASQEYVSTNTYHLGDIVTYVYEGVKKVYKAKLETVDPGRVPTYSNDWTALTTKTASDYVKDDVVIKDDVIYTAIADNPINSPGIGSSWTKYWRIGSVHYDSLYYKYENTVVANNIGRISMYSNKQYRKDCNIIIDWGDGTKTKISDLGDSSVYDWQSYYYENGKFETSKIFVKHSYYGQEYNAAKTYDIDDTVCMLSQHKVFKCLKQSVGIEPCVTEGYEEYWSDCTSEIEQKKFIVKIYGNDYYMLRFGSFDSNPIVSGVFRNDLPLASCLRNISSLCNKSLRILYVQIPYEYDMSHITNLANIFSNCKNLKYYDHSNGNGLNSVQAFSGFFDNCSNLECDISNFDNVFRNGSEDCSFKNTFRSCPKLYGTVNDKIYWNNPSLQRNIEEDIGKDAFYECSEEIRSQTPITWGGLTDNEIQRLPLGNGRYLLIKQGNMSILNLNNEGEFTSFCIDVTDEQLEFQIYRLVNPSKQTCYIEWGDDSEIEIYNVNVTNVSHTYPRSGTYQVNIYGNLDALRLTDSYTSKTEFQQKYSSMVTSVNFIEDFFDNDPYASLGLINYCKNIVSVQIPKKTSCIPSNLFNNLNGLSSYEIPKNITNIKDNNFSYCSSLTSLSFEDGSQLSSIGKDFCYRSINSSLTSISLPSTLQTVGDNMFCDCSSIVSVYFPPSLTSIGTNLFRNSLPADPFNLSVANFKDHTQIPTLGNGGFFNCQKGYAYMIVVPDDLYDDWINADIWKYRAVYIKKYSQVNSIIG